MAIKVGGTTVIDDSRNISNITNLAAVATSGAYADITGTPSIPTADQLLPTQTGNDGSYLTTDGSTASWAAVATGGALFNGNLFQ